ncbi:uridylate kinase [Tolypothrix sp. PCC 7601]|nr:uridylate kinase [Tolypothrix sp. PCC 7601]
MNQPLWEVKSCRDAINRVCTKVNSCNDRNLDIGIVLGGNADCMGWQDNCIKCNAP